MTQRRYWRSERRACWACQEDFTATRADEVYCSATCGRLARGLDEHGGPLPKREAA